MSDIERLDKLASTFHKEAIAPAAIGAGVAALKWIAAHKGAALMYAWMASGVTDQITRQNPIMANLKESLIELVGLVQEQLTSPKLDQRDRGILTKFVESAQKILPKIGKVQNIQQPSLQAIEDLDAFMTDARYVTYNAHNVANITDKIESWYAGAAGFLVGMFGFGLELTDVRKAKARAAEVSATLGKLVSGLEVVMEKTVKEAHRIAAQQQQSQQIAPAGDQVSEFAGLSLG